MTNTAQATHTEKHTRVLACAARPVGCSQDLYLKEARELAAQGLIQSRECFSKVRARRSRWFATAKQEAA
jgi:hypothetical protein